MLTAGLGGMGGAQPMAITMNEGVGLIVEVDRKRAERRRAMGYVDTVVDTLEEAMTLVEEHKAAGKPHLDRADRQRRRYLSANWSCAEVTPDVVTDQTPAHEALMYVPSGMSVAEADALRKSDPGALSTAGHGFDGAHVQAMLDVPASREPRSLTTATTCVSRLTTTASQMHSSSRVCARLHPTAVLRGQGSIPLGCPLR